MRLYGPMKTILKIGLDTGSQDGSIAWALEHPGCFAAGKDGSEALLNMPRAFIRYCEWIERHSPNSWLSGIADFDVRLVETFDCFSITKDFERAAPVETQNLASLPAAPVETQDFASLPAPQDDLYEIGSFFLHDWKPLTAGDVRRGLLLLEWSRTDLLAIVSGLSPEQRTRLHPGERWSIDGILKHVGGAEWWYMNNIGMASIQRPRVSPDPDERLAQVRARLCELLPELVGLDKVVGHSGELWSPRKLLRRALWHELDHIGHIAKLI